MAPLYWHSLISFIRFTVLERKLNLDRNISLENPQKMDLVETLVFQLSTINTITDRCPIHT